MRLKDLKKSFPQFYKKTSNNALALFFYYSTMY